MSYVLELTATPSSQSSSSCVLLCPDSTFLMATVRTPAAGVAGNANGTAAPIYYELGHGGGGAPVWEGKRRLLLPGTTGRSLEFDAVRFWSSVSSAPQYVTAEAD